MAELSKSIKILQIGNPILEKKAERVPNARDEKVRKLINLLTDYLFEDKGSVGLAAPQIGENLAVCVVKKIITEAQAQENEKKEIVEIIPLINPRIVYESELKGFCWEGCLSVGIGEERLFGPVMRAKRVKVKYLDRDGNESVLEAKGFFAHIIQHEIDHLNGILFLKYINDPRNIWKSHDLDKYLEKHEKYPPIAGVGE